MRLLTALLLLSSGLASAQGDDVTPPSIGSLTLNESSFDVSEAPALLRVRAELSDAGSGVQQWAVRFVSPSGNTSLLVGGSPGLTGGSIYQGTFEGATMLPVEAEAGVWRADRMSVTDEAGNGTSIDLEPAGLAVSFSVTRASGSPLSALLAVSVDPSRVDTSTSEATIAVTILLREDVGTVRSWSVVFDSPTGRRTLTITGWPAGPSPTSRQGIMWQATGTLPARSEAGVWTATKFAVTDTAGESSERTLEGGLAASFTVGTPAAAPPPEVGASLTGIVVTPSAVDVTAGEATINVWVSVRDIDVQRWTASFSSPSAAATLTATGTPGRVSGDASQGTYQASAAVGVDAEKGQWTASHVTIVDTAGVERSIDLTAARVPVGFGVSGIAVAQPAATASISVSPSRVDVSQSPQQLTVSLRLGSQAGPVEGWTAQFAGPGGADVFQVQGGPSSAGGTMEASGTLPQGSEPGCWRVRSAAVIDSARNRIELALGAAQACAFEVDSTSRVAAPQLLSLELTPSSILLVTQPVTVTMTAAVISGPGGVRQVRARLTSPSGLETLDIVGGLTRREGAGPLFAGAIDVPVGTQDGTWQLTGVVITDEAGNEWVVDLAAAGISAELDVVTAYPPLDATPAGSVTVSPLTVGQAALPAAITVSFHLAGGAGLHEWSVEFLSPSGLQSLVVAASPGFSGGRYQGSATLAAGSEAGVWTAVSFQATDAAGNRWPLGGGMTGWPLSFEVSGAARALGLLNRSWPLRVPDREWKVASVRSAGGGLLLAVERAAGQPKTARVRVEVSADNGRSWREVGERDTGLVAGHAAASVALPWSARPGEYLVRVTLAPRAGSAARAITAVFPLRYGMRMNQRTERATSSNPSER